MKKSRADEGKKYEELMRITESYIRRLHDKEAAYDSLVLKIMELESQIKEEKRSREGSETWYAVRWERLKELLRENGIYKQGCSIMANGTANPDEPPTYAQRISILKWQLEEAEKKLAAKEKIIEDLTRVH